MFSSRNSNWKRERLRGEREECLDCLKPPFWTLSTKEKVRPAGECAWSHSHPSFCSFLRLLRLRRVRVMIPPPILGKRNVAVRSAVWGHFRQEGIVEYCLVRATAVDLRRHIWITVMVKIFLLAQILPNGLQVILCSSSSLLWP